MIFIPIGRIFSCSLISESVLDIIKLDFTSENSCFFWRGGGGSVYGYDRNIFSLIFLFFFFLHLLFFSL